ncbi:sodium:proton antiporter [Porticoccus sp. W117]|uniref:cation:proton antiporter n=1 Tax=Porticoccus sp. W117 TaxID=3054777 RepID=UPI00259472ED|nr:sodium:proton antiporter [Porticoccus sp. W117]MDM3871487.1 sodium:proton antiporter [Porticoccus sp. W117]
MAIPELIAFLSILLLASLLIPPLAKLIRFPAASLLVVIGYLAAELFIHFGGDTGIRANSFQPLIFYVFLPILIFDSAYHLNAKHLLRNLPAVLWMAILGMGLLALLTAVGVYFGINHPTGFPWTTALVCGALLAATDPVAVVAQIKSSNAPQQLEILLEGESLFNDATAVVLFSLFIALAVGDSGSVTPSAALLDFARLFFGGIAFGAMTGYLASLLSRILKDSYSAPLLTLLLAYGTFYLGEHWLHVSGIMAVLAAGLVLGRSHQSLYSQEQAQPLKQLWGLLGQLGNNLVFLLMGVTVSLAMFTQRWLAILIAIGVVIVARVISTWLSLKAAKLTPGGEPIPSAYQPVIMWGGLRGVVAIALALSLPTDMAGWWTVQAIAFGVVVFSLFVQAPSNQLLLKRLIEKDK